MTDQGVGHGQFTLWTIFKSFGDSGTRMLIAGHFSFNLKVKFYRGYVFIFEESTLNYWSDLLTV